MRTSLFNIVKILLIPYFVIVLSSCSTAKVSPTPDLVWKVALSKYEIKDSLSSVESVTQYNGSVTKVNHQQSPDSGDVYLIMDVTVSKTGDQSATFDWQNLVIEDASGNTYHRLDNDTFLEQYQYTPRITGLALRLGEYSGWMCYEVPTSAAKGKLTLSYTGEGSQQQIVLQQ